MLMTIPVICEISVRQEQSVCKRLFNMSCPSHNEESGTKLRNNFEKNKEKCKKCEKPIPFCRSNDKKTTWDENE